MTALSATEVARTIRSLTREALRLRQQKGYAWAGGPSDFSEDLKRFAALSGLRYDSALITCAIQAAERKLDAAAGSGPRPVLSCTSSSSSSSSVGAERADPKAASRAAASADSHAFQSPTQTENSGAEGEDAAGARREFLEAFGAVTRRKGMPG